LIDLSGKQGQEASANDAAAVSYADWASIAQVLWTDHLDCKRKHKWFRGGHEWTGIQKAIDPRSVRETNLL
jgi:hypothetical protein